MILDSSRSDVPRVMRERTSRFRETDGSPASILATRARGRVFTFDVSRPTLDAPRNHDGDVFSKGRKVAVIEGENRRRLALLGTGADNGVVGATARYAIFRSEPQ